MKFGDPIIYTENGVQHNAIVVSSRVVDDHLGSDKEPLVDLAFFKEVLAPDAKGKLKPKKVIGTSQQHELTQFRVDVAHDSHEYDEEQQRKYGAKQYSGGRWQEVSNSSFTGRQNVEKKGAN